MDRSDQIMLGMGFKPKDAGPNVSALRESVRRQVANGLLVRSGGSWADGAEKLTADERAKELLAWEWAIERGHTYRQEMLDSPLTWRTLPTYLGDRWRELGMKLRVWRDRYVLRLSNPHR